jgi:hypothetical protein
MSIEKHAKSMIGGNHETQLCCFRSAGAINGGYFRRSIVG